MSRRSPSRGRFGDMLPAAGKVIESGRTADDARLIPKIFYERMADGLELFVGCLGFKLLYRDERLAVVERDGAKAYLVESAEFAAKDRPELTIETDTIDEL